MLCLAISRSLSLFLSQLVWQDKAKQLLNQHQQQLKQWQRRNLTQISLKMNKKENNMKIFVYKIQNALYVNLFFILINAHVRASKRVQKEDDDDDEPIMQKQTKKKK